MSLSTPWTTQYVGDCEFELRRQGKWKADVLGCDRFTEEWYGRADKLSDFLDALVLGGRHSTFPAAWLSDWDNSDGESGFATVNLEYTGFRRGSVRAPLYKPSKSIQTISSQATLPDLGKASIEATILAPAGEYTWFQLTDPSATVNPAHYGVALSLSSIGIANALVRFAVTNDQGIVKSISLADMTAALNSFTVITQLQDFSADVVIPGALWHCRSVTVSTLQPS